MIVDVHSFKKDDSTLFRVEYVDYQKTWKTYTAKDWTTKDELTKVIKFLFVDKKNLWSEFEKSDDVKICQDLKWKSIVITTWIDDK